MAIGARQVLIQRVDAWAGINPACGCIVSNAGCSRVTQAHPTRRICDRPQALIDALDAELAPFDISHATPKKRVRPCSVQRDKPCFDFDDDCHAQD